MLGACLPRHMEPSSTAERSRAAMVPSLDVHHRRRFAWQSWRGCNARRASAETGTAGRDRVDSSDGRCRNGAGRQYMKRQSIRRLSRPTGDHMPDPRVAPSRSGSGRYGNGRLAGMKKPLAVAVRPCVVAGVVLRLGAFAKASNANALHDRSRGEPLLTGHEIALRLAGRLTSMRSRSSADPESARVTFHELRAKGYECVVAR